MTGCIDVEATFGHERRSALCCLSWLGCWPKKHPHDQDAIEEIVEDALLSHLSEMPYW